MNKATIATTKAHYLEVRIRESPLESDIEWNLANHLFLLACLKLYFYVDIVC